MLSSGTLQPPLKFFILVMLDQPWKKIDVVTWAGEEKDLHPAVPVLQALVDQGAFGKTEVHIHTVSTRTKRFFFSLSNAGSHSSTAPLMWSVLAIPLNLPGIENFIKMLLGKCRGRS